MGGVGGKKLSPLTFISRFPSREVCLSPCLLSAPFLPSSPPLLIADEITVLPSCRVGHCPLVHPRKKAETVDRARAAVCVLINNIMAAAAAAACEKEKSWHAPPAWTSESSLLLLRSTKKGILLRPFLRRLHRNRREWRCRSSRQLRLRWRRRRKLPSFRGQTPQGRLHDWRRL